MKFILLKVFLLFFSLSFSPLIAASSEEKSSEEKSSEEKSSDIEEEVNKALNHNLFGLNIYGHDNSLNFIRGTSLYYSANTYKVSVYDISGLFRAEHPNLIKIVIAVLYTKSLHERLDKKSFKLAWAELLTNPSSDLPSQGLDLEIIKNNEFIRTQISPYLDIFAPTSQKNEQVQLLSVGTNLSQGLAYNRTDETRDQTLQQLHERIDNCIIRSLSAFPIDTEIKTSPQRTDRDTIQF